MLVEDNPANYAVNESEAEIVTRIFELRAKSTSVRRIAQTLNEDSIPSQEGKLWRKNVLNRMIANPVYYGAACWGKTTSSRILAYKNGVRVPSKIQKFLRPIDRKQWTLNENAGLPPSDCRFVSSLVCFCFSSSVFWIRSSFSKSKIFELSNESFCLSLWLSEKLASKAMTYTMRRETVHLSMIFCPSRN